MYSDVFGHLVLNSFFRLGENVQYSWIDLDQTVLYQKSKAAVAEVPSSSCKQVRITMLHEALLYIHQVRSFCQPLMLKIFSVHQRDLLPCILIVLHRKPPCAYQHPSSCLSMHGNSCLGTPCQACYLTGTGRYYQFFVCTTMISSTSSFDWTEKTWENCKVLSCLKPLYNNNKSIILISTQFCSLWTKLKFQIQCEK